MFAAALVAALLAQPVPPSADGPASAGPAFSIETVPEGLRFVALSTGLLRELSRLAIGPVKEVLRHGSTVYAGLAAGGVLCIDASNPGAPEVVTRLLEGQPLLQLAHRDRDLVVVLASREVVEFSLADALRPVPVAEERSAAASPTEPPAISPYAARGKVLAVGDGTVVIEGGTSAGFRQGEHVKISSRLRLSDQDRLAEAQGLSALGTVTAVVVLERVEAERSLAHLGRGDSAAPGDEVRGTPDNVSESLAAPHQAPFNWRVAATLRPFLDTNNNNQIPAQHAVGVVTDLLVAYYLSGVPLRLEAVIEPLGLAAGGREQHNPAVVSADLAFSSPFFELGVGGGFSSQDNSCESTLPLAGGCSSGVDPVVTQVLRLGALDGLNLSWRSAIASDAKGFSLRTARLQGELPVATRLNLFVGGGGGDNVFAFGEIGARSYVNGTGGAGTVILSGGLGGAGILDGVEKLIGPAFSLAVELRL